jgi:hypothetical protein
MLIGSVLYADNSKRVDELVKERNELTSKRQQMVEVVQKIEVRLIQINAVIEELIMQDENLKDVKTNKKNIQR